MDLEGVRLNWNAFARRDPLWAILTREEKRGGGWDLAEFFRTGEELVAEIGARLTELGQPFGGERALELGCGVGRLSRALLARFRAVDAVDLSEEMLRLAQAMNAETPIRFLHNTRADLDLLGERRYDFALSFLTLQHVPPREARALLGALAARVAPGGTAMVQLPTQSHTSLEHLAGRRGLKGRVRSLVPSALLERYRCLRSGGPRMDMFGLAPEEVRGVLAERGLELLAEDDADDTQGLVPSRRYYALRPNAGGGGSRYQPSG